MLGARRQSGSSQVHPDSLKQADILPAAVKETLTYKEQQTGQTWMRPHSSGIPLPSVVRHKPSWTEHNV